MKDMCKLGRVILSLNLPQFSPTIHHPPQDFTSLKKRALNIGIVLEITAGAF